MRTVLARWLVAIAALLTLAPSHAADPPKEFRGIKWGVAPSASMKKLTVSSDGGSMYAPGKPPASLFGLPVAEEAYLYSKGKFSSGIAWLDGQENFKKVKTKLIEMYGQPEFANENLKLWKWKWPNGVEVHLYFNKDRSTVTYMKNAV